MKLLGAHKKITTFKVKLATKFEWINAAKEKKITRNNAISDHIEATYALLLPLSLYVILVIPNQFQIETMHFVEISCLRKIGRCKCHRTTRLCGIFTCDIVLSNECFLSINIHSFHSQNAEKPQKIFFSSIFMLVLKIDWKEESWLN